MPELYYITCPLFPIRIIKTVIMRVQAAENLLSDPDLGQTLKIVVLFRDPRGLMNSRSKFKWCTKHPYCFDPGTVCKDIQADILAAYKIKERFPGNFYNAKN